MSSGPVNHEEWPTVDGLIGQTPLVRLQRMGASMNGNVLLAKLEGNNPAGSVKDRWALGWELTGLHAEEL